jgi:Ca2+-binding RTX toxin-like protein
VTVRHALEGAVARYEFTDGTVWTPHMLMDMLGLSAGAGLSVYGTPGENLIGGSQGADFISGGAGRDRLNGFGDNDELHGGEGDDTLTGGVGDDLLSGGGGDDEYRFHLGDGVDRLIDTEGATLLRFGQGVAPLGLLATRERIDGVDHVRLAYGEGDAVLIRDDLPLDALSFVFSSGEIWSARDLYAQILVDEGATVIGTDESDALFGHAAADVLQGEGGMDTLQGGAGDDLLDGGAGSDFLHGGSGQDSYLLRAGAGLDRIYEAPGQTSRLVLDGIAPEALRFGRIGNDLFVQHAQSNGAFFIEGAWQAGASWTLVDAQGAEHDLLLLATQAIGAQDLHERQQMFLLAADAQAGPVGMRPQWFAGPPMYRTDESGTETFGAGTSYETAYTLERRTQRIDDDGAFVRMGEERDAAFSSSELLRTERISETHWRTWVSHYEVTDVGIPERLVPLDEFMGDAFAV